MKSNETSVVEFRGHHRSNHRSILDQDPRWALATRVAASTALARALQLRAILLYLVRQAILQPDQPIHESEIAHCVLGRRIDFNPLDNNMVRVQIAHLRKKLNLFFSAEGRHEEVVITIALGTYKPVFTNRIHVPARPVPIGANECGGRGLSDGSDGNHAGSLSHARPEPESVHGPGFSIRKFAWPAFAAVVMVALAFSCMVLWMQNRAMKRSMEAAQRSYYPWRYSPSVSALWSQFLDSNRSTDIVMSDAFFKLAEEMGRRKFTLDDYLSRGFVQQLMLKETNPDARKILGKISMWNSATANHLNLAKRILGLDPQGSKVHLYFARDYRPDLIRQDNVILLGSRISNPWDELFDSRLDFVVSPDGNLLTMITNRAPRAGERTSYIRDDSVGYCVVAYMPNPSSNGKVLLIEGTSVEATEAGGDFLMSEDHMASFQKRLDVKRFPYFELLLKTSQVSGTPFSATIEAYRTYPNLH